jgi:hypothetical protein
VLDNKAFTLERALKVDPDFLAPASSSDSESPPGRAPSATCDTGSPAELPKGTSPDGQECCQGNALEPKAGPSGLLDPAASRRHHKRSREDMPDGADAACTSSAAADTDNESELLRSKAKKPRRQRRAMHDLGGVCSVCARARGFLDKQRFNLFMRDLLSVCPLLLMQASYIAVSHRVGLVTIQKLYIFKLSYNRGLLGLLYLKLCRTFCD